MDSELFNTYSNYLKKRYGKTVYRVGVDGGFSCPNKPDGRADHGCSFCGSFGARSSYLGDSEKVIEEQIVKSLSFLKRRYGAEDFILYFQAYSNTYSDCETLEKIYNYGLSLGNFRELIVSTRPDCIDLNKVLLLKSYIKDGFDVWVELGLQSCNNDTLKRINRGHSYEEFLVAYNLLKEHNIKIVVHFIFGLPGEDSSDILDSVKKISLLKPDGVKFHNLHIPTGTVMYEEYLRGELSFPSSMRHAEYVADAIEYLPAETIVMRVNTDTPGTRHSVPGYFLDKAVIYNTIIDILSDRKGYQGRLYGT